MFLAPGYFIGVYSGTLTTQGMLFLNRLWTSGCQFGDIWQHLQTLLGNAADAWQIEAVLTTPPSILQCPGQPPHCPCTPASREFTWPEVFIAPRLRVPVVRKAKAHGEREVAQIKLFSLLNAVHLLVPYLFIPLQENWNLFPFLNGKCDIWLKMLSLYSVCQFERLPCF